MNRRARAAEAALRAYQRVAPTERGGYRLARLVRRARPTGEWVDRFRTPDGLVFDLDLGVYPDCCMAFGLYELDTARAMRRLVRPGDWVLDVGANIGYMTALAARMVGAGGRVDAFEPEPGNRARLEAHVALNGLSDRVRVHAVALSDRAGEATIHSFAGVAGSNHGSSSLFPHARLSPSATAPVATARLDDVLAALDGVAGRRPRLVKMDVEGAEPLVVSGMAGLLGGPEPPAILGELNPEQARAGGFDALEWVRRAVAAQPRFRAWAVGWRRRPLPADVGDWPPLGQCNVLLRA